MITRTHTFYFGRDELAPLRAAYEALMASLIDRRNYMSTDHYDAALARLTLIRISITLLEEPVRE